MKPPLTITWLQYAFANAVVVVLLPLLTLQGMPPIDWAWSWFKRPKAEAEAEAEEEEFEEDQNPVAGHFYVWTSPLLDATGTWTGPWFMFAPEPDRTNHRIRAEIEYQGGRKVLWRSPEWPELSCWRRFCLSRELEYVDALGGIADRSPEKLALWSVFADHLAREQQTNPEPAGAPQSVRFIVEEATIANPQVEGWQPMSQLYPRDEERVVMTRNFPLPPKMPSNKTLPASGGAP